MNILCWIAGADADLLEECNANTRMKHTAIGVSILLTTFAGILSGGYAFYTIFKNPILSLILGIIWGLFIFNMDRLIVINTHKEDKFSWQQVGMTLTRIFVAFLIAVVVAKPLEVKIFEKPILAELAQENAKNALEFQENLNKGMPEIGKLEAEIKVLEQQLSKKENTRDSLCGQAIQEAEGKSGTGKEGKGPVYEEKKQICFQQEQEFQALKSKIEPILEQNRQRIMQLQSQKDQEFKKVTDAREKADDLVTQLNVLDKISKKNPAIAHASHAISLLFIVVDTAPIFAKLLAKRDSYDAKLQQREYEAIHRADKMRLNYNNLLLKELDKEETFHSQTLDIAYSSPAMKELQEEISQEIVKRTKKKFIPKRKVKLFDFFFSN